MKKLLLLTILGATIVASVASPTGVAALSGSQFHAGRIIDDSVFENNHSMSVGQIQAFLDSKVACDRWGTEPSEYGGGTRAQYGAARGNPAPYTCLNAYFENPTT